MAEGKGKNTFKCPACQEALTYKNRLRVYAFVEATEDQESDEGKRLTDGGQTSQRFECPKCKTLIQFIYEIRLIDVRVCRGDSQPDEVSPVETTPGQFSYEELELIKTCRDNGLLDVFAQVVKVQTHVLHRLPKDLEKFFISFLRTAQPSVLPRQALHEFAREFPGVIQFWKAQRIGMVISDGQICRFIPIRAMNMEGGERAAHLPLSAVDVGRNAENFDFVKRTTIGYVPQSARIFLQSLLHATGHRGREMQNVPLRPKK